MPLSKKKDRERKQKFQPNSNLNKEGEFQPKLAELRKLMDSVKPSKLTVILPFCVWCDERHDYGTHSRPLPELDADGHTIPSY